MERVSSIAQRLKEYRDRFSLTLAEVSQKCNVPTQFQFTPPHRGATITSQVRYRRHWKRYCAANGIPYITPYELRHTFVSVVKNLPEGEIKSLVGHSKSMDTFGIYSHAIDGEEQQVAIRVNSLFVELLEKYRKK